MYFSYNWIKNYVAVTKRPETIARVLTEHAFETEVVDEESRKELLQTAGVGHGTRDTLLSVDILPDRAADCSSHIGIARELAVLLGADARIPKLKPVRFRGKAPYSISVEDRADCARYIAVRVSGLRNGPSPKYMQQRLRSIGITPQNLIVDCTNYVLWETGQPTHAFVAEGIGKRIGIRKSRADEGHMRTLDGEERSIPRNILLITSNDKPVAFAGVMGGIETAVQDHTSDVVIESAQFGGNAIRESVRALGLRTDASDRFSRGVTSAHVTFGMARVVELLIQHGGGKVSGYAEHGTGELRLPEFPVPHEAIEHILGMNVNKKEVVRILRSLGFTVRSYQHGHTVRAPEFRSDIAIVEDVVEEVGRVLGYGSIPAELPHAPLAAPPLPVGVHDVRVIQNAFRGAGWVETMSYSFAPEDETKASGFDRIAHIGVMNPMNENQRRLRLSLIPGLLRVARNEIKREPVLRMFEVGSVYPARGKEETWVAAILTRRTRAKQDAQSDFYEAKGILEHIGDALHMPDFRFCTASPTPQRSLLSLWRDGAVAELFVDKVEIGCVGIVSDTVLEQLGMRGSVVVCTMNVSAISEVNRLERVYNPPLPYPTIQRDISLALPSGVLVDNVFAVIQEIGGTLVRDIDMVDMYDSDDATRGITTRIIFGSPERTLTDKEIEPLEKRIFDGLTERLGVTKRE